MNRTCTCGCCEGIEKLTPLPIANRPGLQALAYRVGTHASFLETMLARLSDLQFKDDQGNPIRNPLLALKTRAAEDPAIALVDAWATAADVLTFYQERIANEGYLLTATERRSILELANLVGYRLRPGVAASVYLAFNMEKDFEGEIPSSTRAQSIPGPGELPQTFETAEPLFGKTVWNELKPRMSRPQRITLAASDTDDDTDARNIKNVFLKGTATNLKVNDLLLFTIESTQPGASNAQVPRRIIGVEVEATTNRTKVTLGVTQGNNGSSTNPTKFTDFFNKLRGPLRPGAIPPPRAIHLFRSLTAGFRNKSDLSVRVLTEFRKDLRTTSYEALRVAAVTTSSEVKVYAMRIAAPLFGHNAPKEPKYEPALIPDPSSPGHFIPNPNAGNLKPQSTWNEWDSDGEAANTIFLDKVYEQIVSKSYIAIQSPASTEPQAYTIMTAESVSRFAYGISAKATKITLDTNWWSPNFPAIRKSIVYAQSELLTLADEPITESIGVKRDAGKPLDEKESLEARRIDLDNVYDGLESGRWLMISGERDDIEKVTKITAKELAMLAAVTQEFESDRLGDKTHTVLELANELAFSYKRDTVTINANVVRATHGETRQEVLGSGDSSKSFQEFALRQSPLTYVSATTPTGIESSLQLRVNGIVVHETDSLVGLRPTVRRFITRTSDDGKTSVVFGDGAQGARLPTGVENVTAVYRNGIGKAGNVGTGQISLLTTRPLGVKGVLNPQAASGGADPENRDDARLNATLHLKALDRAVTVPDYADFARAFTGIGKARAIRISDGNRELVHLTIAGADDILIEPNSDLYRNLRQALFDFGDPHQPLELEARELKLLVISAKVRLLPDYLWEAVEPRIRALLLEVFGFERRDLGQDVTLSEVISAIQAVAGVDYVDVDKLDGLNTTALLAYLKKLEDLREGEEEPPLIEEIPPPRIVAELARADLTIAEPANRILPAQLVYLTPNVRDTLILTELSR